MRINSLALTALLAFASPAYASSFEALLDPQSSNHVGVEARTLSGEIRDSFQSQKLFCPASVLKIVTAATALELLGPGFRIPTILAGDGRLAGNTYAGNIYLRGQGDPSLRRSDLDAFVKALKGKGIQRIEGDLIAETTSFDEEGYPPGWMHDDLAEGYAPPVRGLALDGNAYAIRLRPGQKVGDPVTFSPIVGLTLLNEAKTANAPTRLRVRREPGFVSLSGTLGLHDTAVVEGALPDPSLATVTKLADKLKQAGIILSGTVRVGAAPKEKEQLAVHWSPRLQDLVTHMNKHSDNLYAESLLKQLGQGRRENGLAAVRRVLERAGWQSGSYCVMDGSGLSRYNQVTPAQLSQLLVYAKELPGFRDSLPIAGVDGTLVNRLRGVSLKAKTGTMAGVSCLAGYLDTADETLAVTVMVNGFVGSAAPQRSLQDRLVQSLIK